MELLWCCPAELVSRCSVLKHCYFTLPNTDKQVTGGIIFGSVQCSYLAICRSLGDTGELLKPTRAALQRAIRLLPSLPSAAHK